MADPLKGYILDTSALLSFVEGSAGSEKVADLLEQGRLNNVSVAMCVVNWGEAYYNAYRTIGPTELRRLKQAIRQFPIALVNVDLQLAELAAEIKIQHKLSYSDAFPAALALMRREILVTSDKDFKRIQGRIPIMWLSSH